MSIVLISMRKRAKAAAAKMTSHDKAVTGLPELGMLETWSWLLGGLYPS